MVTAAQHTLPTSSADDATLVRYVIQPVPGATAEPAKPAAPTFGGGGSYGSPFTGAGAGAGFASLAAAADEIDL